MRHHFVIPIDDNADTAQATRALIEALDTQFPDQVDCQGAFLISTESAHLVPLFRQLARHEIVTPDPGAEFAEPAPEKPTRQRRKRRQAPAEDQAEPAPEEPGPAEIEDVVRTCQCGAPIGPKNRTGLCRQCASKTGTTRYGSYPAQPDEGEPEYQEPSTGKHYTLAEIKRAVTAGRLSLGTTIEHRDGVRYRVVLSRSSRPTLTPVRTRQTGG
jgi:hypothetical protein